MNEELAKKDIASWATLKGYVEIEYKWPWDALCGMVQNVDPVHSLIFTNFLGPKPGGRCAVRHRSTAMRLMCIFVVSVICLSLSSAMSQEPIVVPLVDKSGTGSPLEVGGTILLRENVRANELEWSWGEKISARNVSTKPIVLFVAFLAEIGRHNSDVGHHGAPGNGPTYQLEEDRFFSEKLIQPSETLMLRDTTLSNPEVACCINPLGETHPPSAEFRMQFVQFADGSIFGDPDAAKNSLALRRTIDDGLRELVRSYTDRGAAGFVERLKQPSTFSDTAPYRQIFSAFSEAGVSEALRENRRMLASAERHAALIGEGLTNSNASLRK